MTFLFLFLRKLIQRVGKWVTGKISEFIVTELDLRIYFKRQCNKLNQRVCFEECF